jgi:hypothetical protein
MLFLGPTHWALWLRNVLLGLSRSTWHFFFFLVKRKFIKSERNQIGGMKSSNYLSILDLQQKMEEIHSENKNLKVYAPRSIICQKIRAKIALMVNMMKNSFFK